MHKNIYVPMIFRALLHVHVKTGVKQGCLLSPFLFLLAIDYIMRESTEVKKMESNGQCGNNWTT